MAMVAERPDVLPILRELLSSSGTDVMVRNSMEYAVRNEHLSFRDLQRRVRRKDGWLLLGWKISFENEGKVVINPADQNVKKRWIETNWLVVIGRPRPGGHQTQKEELQKAASAFAGVSVGHLSHGHPNALKGGSGGQGGYLGDGGGQQAETKADVPAKVITTKYGGAVDVATTGNEPTPTGTVQPLPRE